MPKYVSLAIQPIKNKKKYYEISRDLYILSWVAKRRGTKCRHNSQVMEQKRALFARAVVQKSKSKQRKGWVTTLTEQSGKIQKTK